MILPYNTYNHVFGPFRGARVYFFTGHGNVGDDLIHAATRQLFRHYSIIEVGPDDHPEVAMYGGGGNMGHLYPSCKAIRTEVIGRLKCPVIILPQSWSGPDDTRASRYYVRENVSLMYCPVAQLAPDLALCYDIGHSIRKTDPVGVFFRQDVEGTIDRHKSSLANLGDPTYLVKNYIEYVELAGRYRHIHTDRLHFAIAGMLAGSQVTLYPNSYHKNQAIYEMWLTGRNCTWQTQPLGMHAAKMS